MGILKEHLVEHVRENVHTVKLSGGMIIEDFFQNTQSSAQKLDQGHRLEVNMNTMVPTQNVQQSPFQDRYANRNAMMPEMQP